MGRPPGTPRLCDVDGCDRPHQAKGYCQPHYMRFRSYGDPLGSKPPSRFQPGNKSKSGTRGTTYKHDVQYRSAHQRCKSLWGSASNHPCAYCEGKARDWAYDHTDPTEKHTTKLNQHGVTIEVTYSAWPEFYIPLCKRCHTVFDRVR